MASSTFVIATLIEVCAEVIQPNFVFNNWQYTLLMLAFVVVTIGFNTVGAKTLPALETVSLFGHLAGWIITFIALWVLCPRNSATNVFATFVNSGGWSSIGVSCLIGQVEILYCNLGSDSIVHICMAPNSRGHRQLTWLQLRRLKTHRW